MPRAGSHPLLAFELGAAVDAQRAGGVVFAPGLLAAAVEHVIGGVVHQPGADALSLDFDRKSLDKAQGKTPVREKNEGVSFTKEIAPLMFLDNLGHCRRDRRGEMERRQAATGDDLE